MHDYLLIRLKNDYPKNDLNIDYYKYEARLYDPSEK